MPTAKRRRVRIMAWSLFVCGLFGIVGGLWLWRTVEQQHLNRSLISAIRRNDTGDVIAYLREGADPNCHDSPEGHASVWQMLYAKIRGRTLLPAKTLTALQLAARPKEAFEDLLDASDLPANIPDNLELLRALLERGADPNAPDPQGYTTLLYALRWHKHATAELLLAHGANPDEGDRNRVTPLMFAVYMGDNGAIRLLLKRGAHVNAQDAISGQTALMLAITLKLRACITTLMAAHPDLTIRDYNHKSALDYAHEAGYDALLDLKKRSQGFGNQ